MDTEESGNQELQERRAQPAAPAARPSPWPDLKGVHVFLVEDNADTRTMVSEVMAYCGAVVSVYQAGDAAIADLAEFAPTLFICDLSLPGLDGLAFMRRVRTLPAERGGTIPSIAITAYYEDFAAARALEAGFNAYLIKPIKLDELCRLVKELAAGG